MINAGQPVSWARRDTAWLVAVAAWAVFLRVLFVAVAGQHPFFQTPIMDMSYHDAWARRIATGDWLGSEVFFRAPLYPYFLGLLYKIGGGSIIFARYVQAFIGGVSAVLLFLLGRDLFGRKAAVIAALTFATMWTAIYYDVELKLVVLEVPLGLALVFFSQRAIRSGSVRYAAPAGAALGLNAITRPNVLLVGAALGAVFIIIKLGRGIKWRRVLVQVATFYAAAACFIGVVAVRNYKVGHEWVMIAWQGGVNLWIGNNPASDGITAITPGTYGDWWRGHYETIRLAEEAEGRPLRKAEVDAYYFRKVASFLKEDPGRASHLLLWKAYVFGNAYEVANNFDLNYLRKKFWLLKYDPISLYVVLPFAIFGIVAFARDWRRLAPTYAFVIFYSASVILFFVNARFRMPVVPYFVLFAAAAFMWFWDNVRKWRAGRTAAYGVALLGLFAFCDADPFRVGGRSTYESQAHYTMGSIYLEKGDLDAAEEEYHLALESLWSIAGADALNDLGIIAARRDDYALAEDYFKRAVRYQPNYAKGWNNLGNLALRRGDASAAKAYYKHAMAVDAGDARAPYFYGRLLAREDDAAGAKAAFKRAVYLQPNFTEAWFELGKLAYEHGDAAGAAHYYERAAYYAPENPGPRVALANVKLASGDYAGAETDYKIALKVRENPQARYNLACVLARQGKNEDALRQLERAVALAPARYRPLAATDPDLAPLRGDPRFRRLVP